MCPLVAASEHWWRSPRRRRTEVPMSPHWGGIRVAARTGRGQAKIPGRPRMEVYRLPQWGGILVAGGGSIEVAAGGKGRGRLRMMPGPVCMEKGFATLPVNATQAVATVAVRIWFGSHARAGR